MWIICLKRVSHKSVYCYVADLGDLDFGDAHTHNCLIELTSLYLSTSYAHQLWEVNPTARQSWKKLVSPVHQVTMSTTKMSNGYCMRQ